MNDQSRIRALENQYQLLRQQTNTASSAFNQQLSAILQELALLRRAIWEQENEWVDHDE